LNLVVTCGRNLESEAEIEIKKILEENTSEESKILKTGMRGILTVETKIDPLEFIDYVKKKINEEPWSIRYCLRIIPIQHVTVTSLAEIKQSVEDLKDIIQKDDSYRITVEKRNSDISSLEVISAVANTIQNKVSLENPDWIVQIEIFGNKTGVSILKKNTIFSLERAKRNLE
jgi:tRNA acetyltransferase TAN1